MTLPSAGHAQETIGGGTIASPAVGPAPSYGLGPGFILVKIWNFGTNGNGLRFEYKTSTGGTHVSTGASPGAAPYWVRLVRSGNTFTGYWSTDGVNWTQSGTIGNAMTAGVNIGLSVNGACSAVLDNVTAAP